MKPNDGIFDFGKLRCRQKPVAAVCHSDQWDWSYLEHSYQVGQDWRFIEGANGRGQ